MDGKRMNKVLGWDTFSTNSTRFTATDLSSIKGKRGQRSGTLTFEPKKDIL